MPSESNNMARARLAKPAGIVRRRSHASNSSRCSNDTETALRFDIEPPCSSNSNGIPFPPIREFETVPPFAGRCIKQIRAHLLGDLLLVRMSGVLTQAELQLLIGSKGASGSDLVKRMRSQLIETASPLIEKIVENVTGVNVLSTLFDIGFSTDEEFILFTLSDAPRFRDTAKR